MNQSLLNCVLAALISLTAASLMRRAPARCVLQSSQNRMIPRIGSFLFRARSSPSFMRSMLPLQMSFVRYRISVGLPRDGRGVRMWVDFCLAVLTGAAVLYGPGFFAWRALGMRGLAALSCAPLFSILAYSILGASVQTGSSMPLSSRRTWLSGWSSGYSRSSFPWMARHRPFKRMTTCITSPRCAASRIPACGLRCTSRRTWTFPIPQPTLCREPDTIPRDGISYAPWW